MLEVMVSKSLTNAETKKGIAAPVEKLLNSKSAVRVQNFFARLKSLLNQPQTENNQQISSLKKLLGNSEIEVEAEAEAEVRELSAAKLSRMISLINNSSSENSENSEINEGEIAEMAGIAEIAEIAGISQLAELKDTLGNSEFMGRFIEIFEKTDGELTRKTLPLKKDSAAQSLGIKSRIKTEEDFSKVENSGIETAIADLADQVQFEYKSKAESKSESESEPAKRSVGTDLINESPVQPGAEHSVEHSGEHLVEGEFVQSLPETKIQLPQDESASFEPGLSQKPQGQMPPSVQELPAESTQTLQNSQLQSKLESVSVADPVVVADPANNSVAEPEAGPVVDPQVEPIAAPQVEPVADPQVDLVADPQVDLVADPVVDTPGPSSEIIAASSAQLKQDMPPELPSADLLSRQRPLASTPQQVEPKLETKLASQPELQTKFQPDLQSQQSLKLQESTLQNSAPLQPSRQQQRQDINAVLTDTAAEAVKQNEKVNLEIVKQLQTQTVPVVTGIQQNPEFEQLKSEIGDLLGNLKSELENLLGAGSIDDARIIKSDSTMSVQFKAENGNEHLNQLIERIATNLETARSSLSVNGRSTSFNMTLDPEWLGKLNLRIRTVEGGMEARIICDSVNGKALLESGLNQLTAQLQDRGFNQVKLEIQLSGEQSGQSGSSTPEGSGNNQQQGSFQRGNQTENRGPDYSSTNWQEDELSKSGELLNSARADNDNQNNLSLVDLVA